MKSNKLLTLFLIFLYLIINSDVVNSQQNFKTVGKYTYSQYDNNWYTTTNGKKGDKINTHHLVVRPKEKISIEEFNLSSLGLLN